MARGHGDSKWGFVKVRVMECQNQSAAAAQKLLAERRVSANGRYLRMAYTEAANTAACHGVKPGGKLLMPIRANKEPASEH